MRGDVARAIIINIIAFPVPSSVTCDIFLIVLIVEQNAVQWDQIRHMSEDEVTCAQLFKSSPSKS